LGGFIIIGAKQIRCAHEKGQGQSGVTRRYKYDAIAVESSLDFAVTESNLSIAK
jgi:hypothetical protein